MNTECLPPSIKDALKETQEMVASMEERHKQIQHNFLIEAAHKNGAEAFYGYSLTNVFRFALETCPYKQIDFRRAWTYGFISRALGELIDDLRRPSRVMAKAREQFDNGEIGDNDLVSELYEILALRCAGLHCGIELQHEFHEEAEQLIFVPKISPA